MVLAGSAPKYIQSWTIGDQLDRYFLAFGFIMFDQVLDVIVRNVHKTFVVLINMKRDIVRFSFRQRRRLN